MKIIRMHEGELQVQSEENKGTIVTMLKKPTLKILMLNLRKFNFNLRAF
jgi:signal transduction histidine kinase